MNEDSITNEFEASVEFRSQWVDAIILNTIYHHQVLVAPCIQIFLGPRNRLSNTQYSLDADSLQHLRVVRMSEIAQIHVWEHSAWQ